MSRTKKQYDAAVAVLSDLLDMRDALKRDEMVKAIMKSERTYEEVLTFLRTESEKEECQIQKKSRKNKRYHRQTLTIVYDGRTISDIPRTDQF